MVYQTMHFLNKKVSKALRQKLVQYKMKNSNVREYPIACDTLLITDAEYGVTRRVPKPVLQCCMKQLNNDIITRPDDGVLLGSKHANTNDLIISDTMLRSLAPPQLHPMTYNQKRMCGCAICNNSKCSQ